ncbi:MAG: hypothetical protein HQL61_08375 [Magnetococcales bacterium]|nr:hypothetical protein [Nitrospirota bacterium]
MTINPQDIVRDAQNYADKQMAEARSFIDRLAQIGETEFTLTRPVEWSWGLFDRSQEALDAIRTAKPARFSITTEAATVPNMPDVDVTLVTPTGVDGLDAYLPTQAPVLNIPPTPKISLPTRPEVPTFGDGLSLPSKPNLDIPAVPNIEAADIPPPPNIAIEAFSTPAPLFDLTAPTERFQFDEPMYTSLLQEALSTALLHDIGVSDPRLNDAGSSDSGAVDTMLWEAAREREHLNAAVEIEDVRRTFAASGFVIPTGAMFAAIDRARQKAANAASTVNRDIAVKQAELAVKNRQFAIEKAIALEGLLISFHNSLAERSLNAAKAALEAGIRLYNLKVENYNAAINGFKAAAIAYETNLKGLTARAELYKTHAETEHLRAQDKNNAIIELYKLQCQQLNTIQQAYKTEMEAANLYATMEGLRLEGFKANVDAYKAGIEGSDLEFKLHEAAVNAETIKINLYDNQLKTYQSALEGKKLLASLNDSNIKAQVDNARLKLEAYNAQLGAYKATLQQQQLNIDAATKMQSAELQAYSSEAAAVAKSFELFIQSGKLNADTNIEVAKQSISRAELELKKLAQQASLRINAATAASDVYKNLASGALSAINALASINESIS